MNSKQKILTAIKVDWTPIFLVVIPYVEIFLRDYWGGSNRSTLMDVEGS